MFGNYLFLGFVVFAEEGRSIEYGGRFDSLEKVSKIGEFINFSFSRLFSEIGIIVLSTTVSTLKFNQEDMENVTGLHNTLTAVKSETKARKQLLFSFLTFFLMVWNFLGSGV